MMVTMMRDVDEHCLCMDSMVLATRMRYHQDASDFNRQDSHGVEIEIQVNVITARKMVPSYDDSDKEYLWRG